MTLSPTTLSRSAGLAAVASGLLFIGVQVAHPHLDAVTVTSTEMLVRDSLKVVMAALALLGITGMYLRQVRQAGVLGLVGYLLLAAGYLLIACTAFVAAYVLPSVAAAVPAYVDDVTAVATGGQAVGDIGHLATVIKLQGVAYLGGGLLLGVAMYRARVLARWACLLLAVGGVVSAALTFMPDAFFRLLAFPNGIAMIALGWSLWSVGGSTTGTGAAAGTSPVLAATAVE